MSTPRRSLSLLSLAFVSALSLGLLGPSGCRGISYTKCRLDPAACPGDAGALCNEDRDCNGGLECCTDDNNCGGGMCTLSCKDDYDCPGDMGCKHGVCFYLCDSDDDCAPTMSCEHGNTVCEYD